MKKQLLITKNQIKPTRPDFKVFGVFNPAIIKVADEYIMFARVAETVALEKDSHVVIPVYRNNDYTFLKFAINDPNYDFSDVRVIRNHRQNYLTSISHFRIGRSKDGYNFTFDDTPILPDSIYEEFGIEDPRITKIDDKYYISYTAVSEYGINVRLMVTADFKKFTRLGNIFHFDNKDVVLFPKKIGGYYYAYHRPSTSEFGRLDMWVAKSTNLLHWGEHEVLTGARIDYTASVRLGAGAVPYLTKEGWIVIYHTADSFNRYHLAALLVDKDDPSKVLKRSKKPLIFPTELFEKEGLMPEVVFTCGAIFEKNEIKVYYGVCDEAIAVATLTYDEIYENLGEVL